MKLIVSTLLVLFAANSVYAAGTYRECGIRAVKEVRYEGEEAFLLECVLADNNAAVICEVQAEKGGGAASDHWRVVLTKSCKTVLRTELLGEE